MSSYPKWLYHPSKEPCVVADEAAHKGLSADWVESPADFPRVEIAEPQTLATAVKPKKGK